MLAPDIDSPSPSSSSVMAAIEGIKQLEYIIATLEISHNTLVQVAVQDRPKLLRPFLSFIHSRRSSALAKLHLSASLQFLKQPKEPTGFNRSERYDFLSSENEGFGIGTVSDIIPEAMHVFAGALQNETVKINYLDDIGNNGNIEGDHVNIVSSPSCITNIVICLITSVNPNPSCNMDDVSKISSSFCNADTAIGLITRSTVNPNFHSNIKHSSNSSSSDVNKRNENEAHHDDEQVEIFSDIANEFIRRVSSIGEEIHQERRRQVSILHGALEFAQNLFFTPHNLEIPKQVTSLLRTTSYYISNTLCDFSLSYISPSTFSSDSYPAYSSPVYRLEVCLETHTRRMANTTQIAVRHAANANMWTVVKVVELLELVYDLVTQTVMVDIHLLKLFVRAVLSHLPANRQNPNRLMIGPVEEGIEDFVPPYVLKNTPLVERNGFYYSQYLYNYGMHMLTYRLPLAVNLSINQSLNHRIGWFITFFPYLNTGLFKHRPEIGNGFNPDSDTDNIEKMKTRQRRLLEDAREVFLEAVDIYGKTVVEIVKFILFIIISIVIFLTFIRILPKFCRFLLCQLNALWIHVCIRAVRGIGRILRVAWTPFIVILEIRRERQLWYQAARSVGGLGDCRRIISESERKRNNEEDVKELRRVSLQAVSTSGHSLEQRSLESTTVRQSTGANEDNWVDAGGSGSDGEVVRQQVGIDEHVENNNDNGHDDRNGNVDGDANVRYSGPPREVTDDSSSSSSSSFATSNRSERDGGNVDENETSEIVDGCDAASEDSSVVYVTSRFRSDNRNAGTARRTETSAPVRQSNEADTEGEDGVAPAPDVAYAQTMLDPNRRNGRRRQNLEKGFVRERGDDRSNSARILTRSATRRRKRPTVEMQRHDNEISSGDDDG